MKNQILKNNLQCSWPGLMVIHDFLFSRYTVESIEQAFLQLGRTQLDLGEEP
ncbi:MAG: hypothetical protein ABSA71_12310 [Desulfomonilia bacterium]